MSIDEVIAVVVEVTGASIPVQSGTPLLSTGILDSFHVVALLAALRSRYQVSILLDDVGADNFDTPEQILAFLRSRS